MPGRPLHDMFPAGLCQARTRRGTLCKIRQAVFYCKTSKRFRCKYHGGMSTGAKTPEGIARIVEAQKKRWRLWREKKAKDFKSR